MKIDGNEIKIGNIIEHKNKLWKVIKTQHTQPGKGGAYLQVELKDLKHGTKLNERFRSSESVEKIRLEEKNYQYLYKENNLFYFMDLISFDQITLNNDIISNFQEKFLFKNQNVIIEDYEGIPISIKLPENINLKVIETDAVIKGQTATSSYKPAILENGFRTQVPPHIVAEDHVVISTYDGSYIEKVKSK
tara:strand:+ start:405 stop:977 length:573 start_codon:yes stop_codon:yes gene_type:complete